MVPASTILLALGANMAGPWGEPRASLARSLCELAAAGLVIVRSSSLYSTAPVGPGRQARYLNAVVEVRGSVAPATLLGIVKQIERRAGRRLGRHWGPRPLDIDLIDFGGRRIGRPPERRRPGQLLLPHPEMHRRAFVLLPLQEIAPSWRHPRLGVGVATLLARLGAGVGSRVRRVAALAPDLAPDPALDSAVAACDKQCK